MNGPTNRIQNDNISAYREKKKYLKEKKKWPFKNSGFLLSCPPKNPDKYFMLIINLHLMLTSAES